MKVFSSTIARACLGRLLNMAQSEPVLIQRRDSEDAVVLSPEEYRRLWDAASGKVSPAVQKLHAESAKRWAKVYAALSR